MITKKWKEIIHVVNLININAQNLNRRIQVIKLLEKKAPDMDISAEEASKSLEELPILEEQSAALTRIGLILEKPVREFNRLKRVISINNAMTEGGKSTGALLKDANDNLKFTPVKFLLIEEEQEALLDIDKEIPALIEKDSELLKTFIFLKEFVDQ